MRPKLQALFAVAILLFSHGFHVAALQGMAWARMYADYQQSLPPLQAIEHTIAGNELCNVCRLSIHLREKANDALDGFLNTPQPILVGPAETGSLLTAPLPSYHAFTIPLSRIPFHTVSPIVPPPPKSLVS